MYRSIHPLFSCIASSLSQYDASTLYTLLTTYSSDQWKILEHPLPETVRASTISFIKNIDSFITTFLIQHSITSLALNLLDFSSPKVTSKPSIVHQVSFTEITVDPYLRAHRKNYCYPLSYLTKPDSTPMHIDEAPTPDNKNKFSRNVYSSSCPSSKEESHNSGRFNGRYLGAHFQNSIH